MECTFIKGSSVIANTAITSRKLIRNGYINIIEQNEDTKLTICPINERKDMLIKKLEEEVKELISELTSDDNRDKIGEEMDDVYDVLNEIRNTFNATVLDLKYRKHNILGGFDHYVVLEETK